MMPLMQTPGTLGLSSRAMMPRQLAVDVVEKPDGFLVSVDAPGGAQRLRSVSILCLLFFGFPSSGPTSLCCTHSLARTATVFGSH